MDLTELDVYLVGGAVRDRLLGLEVKDRDWVVVGSTPEQMLAMGFLQVGADFPVFIHPKSGEEYALARTERKVSKGYHGFQVDAAPSVTLEEDLLRRDLTINAMAMDKDGKLIDPYDGHVDLVERRLKHVSYAFVEDPVRVLRVARFAARYQKQGFAVCASTQALMRELVQKGELDTLVPERVWKELELALHSAGSFAFFKELDACDALAVVLPEIASFVMQNKKTQVLIDQFSADEDGSMLKFVSLVLNTDISAFCERLRVPNGYKKAAIKLQSTYQDYEALSQRNAAAYYAVLQNLDALKQVSYLDMYLRFCDAYYADENHHIVAENLYNTSDALRQIDMASELAKLQDKTRIADFVASIKLDVITEVLNK